MPEISSQHPWLVSLHGGHSGEFCDHAQDRLEQLVQGAIALGMPVYGLTEHAPRVEPQHVYDEEKAMGWNTDYLAALFARYAAEAKRLQVAYADQIEILAGFEAEVIPEGRYVEVMRDLRDQHALDYFVGSVHWVDGVIIDYTRDRFDQAVAAQGGLERLALRYYDIAAEMVSSLRPEVVGHLDLVRRHGGDDPALETPAVRERARAVLALMKEHDAILDINTAGYRKGLGSPYPTPWLLEAARNLGVACCFGDDAHRVLEVGAGILEAREYLLAHGIAEVTVLVREAAGLGRRKAAL
jgi:histidinol-phosphatase (PHP family)